MPIWEGCQTNAVSKDIKSEIGTVGAGKTIIEIFLALLGVPIVHLK
jgi:hypothetical protein